MTRIPHHHDDEDLSPPLPLSPPCPCPDPCLLPLLHVWGKGRDGDSDIFSSAALSPYPYPHPILLPPSPVSTPLARRWEQGLEAEG